MKEVKLVAEYIFMQEEGESNEEFDQMINDFLLGSNEASNGICISEGLSIITKETIK
jgi:hypothetical protein